MSQNRTVARSCQLLLGMAAALAVSAALPVAAQQCGGWVVSDGNPFPASGAVIWADGRYIAVGTSVATSFDGRRWMPQGCVEPMVRDYRPYMVDVAHHGARFVAVGSAFAQGEEPTGSVAISDDGVVWTEVARPDARLSVVAWGGDTWVAGGDGGIFWSRDGTAWHKGSGLSEIRELQVDGLVRLHDRWVAVGARDDYHGWIATSPFGMSWTVVSETEWMVTSVASGGEMAVATSGKTVLASQDGLAWSAEELPTQGQVGTVAWTGRRFVAGGSWSIPDAEPQAVLVTSDDGRHWAVQFDGYESPFPGIVEFVTGGPVVLATTYDSAPLLSSDAISWELAGGMRPLPSFRRLHAGAEGVVGLYSESAGPYPWLGTSRSVTISKDGIRWKRYSTGRLNFKDVAWRDGLFVAVGWKLFSTESIFVSGDGESWTPAVSGVPPEENGLAAVATGPPGFVAVGGHHGVLFSADGVTWQGTQISGGGFDDVVWSVDWAGDRFVVTARDSIATSADGLAWKVAEINGVPLSFAGNGERIVGVGSDGLVLLSLNGGSTWMTLDAGTTDDLVGVIWDGSEFAAVSADGLFLTSPDGMTWTSEEIGGSIFPSGLGMVDGGLVVVGWNGNVALRDCPSRSVGAVSDRAVVVPGAAHVSGANGTAWRSDLGLANAGNDPVRADLWLLGEAGVAASGAPVSFVIASGQVTPLHDLVGELFEGKASAGAVLIDPDGPLEVTSRTYTVAGGGSFGQNVPALGSLDTVRGGASVVIPGLAETAGYRSNLGLVNLNGEELTVRVEMRAADGSVLGEREYALPPYGWRQVDRVLQEVAGDPVPLASAVLSGSGQDVAFAAYASVIDNASGDPVMTIPMAAVGEPIVFPAAAHTSGYGGVAWRTDLDVVNPGIDAAAYHLELLPGDGGGVAASPTFTLAPGAAVRYQDLLDTVFGVSGAGGVRVVPESGKVAATSRTYAVGAAGSYGQAVPGFPESRVAAGSGSGMLAGLSSSPADDAGFRTNIGAVNLTGEALTLHIALYAGGGQLLGGKDLAVPAHGFAQTDRAFRGVVDTPVVDGYAVVGWDGEPGALLAYASVIDNRTGDPVLIPAVARGDFTGATR